MQGIWDGLSDYATRWHDFWEIIRSLFSSGATMFQDIFFAPTPTPIEVTNFPTTNWDRATAFGTVGAVVVSLAFSIIETMRRVKAEKARDAAEAKQRESEEIQELIERQELVSKVAVWLDVILEPVPSSGHQGEKPKPREFTAMTIRNYSDLPVFDVLPGFMADGVAQLSPHFGEHHGYGPIFTHLHPGEHLTIEVPTVRPDGKPVGDADALFSFRDVQGVRWFRDWTGLISGGTGGPRRSHHH